jgi:formylmethanofuran dehydrogenase subunit E
MNVPDNFGLWESHEIQLERQRMNRPRCCECGEHIQSIRLYRIHGDIYCPDCIEDFAEEVEAYE